MPETPTKKLAWIQTLLPVYRDIQKLGGDKKLRTMLSAGRAATHADRMMTVEEKAERIAGLDLIEEELLGTSRTPPVAPNRDTLLREVKQLVDTGSDSADAMRAVLVRYGMTRLPL